MRRYLMIGAHPDDADLLFGGSAIRLARAGHRVKFVSLCNGDCGHHRMPSAALAERRRMETRAAAAVAGLDDYEVLDNHDCTLEASLANRAAVTRIIREFQPDVVISHRTCDYHPDHRATGQIVQDTAYLVKVPLYCPELPISSLEPVYAFSLDFFTDPRPFRVDAAVPIDEVIEDKFRMLDCHRSQFYEWLPWETGRRELEPDRMSWAERCAWLDEHWECDSRRAARLAGLSGVKYAEVFELSPYGRRVTLEEFQDLFRP